MKTSKFEVAIRRDVIEATHEIWEIRTSGKYIQRGAAVLDSKALQGEVEALSFAGGNRALAMLPTGPDNRALLKEAINASGDPTLSFARVYADAIDDRDMLRLLLASLAKSRFDHVACSNLGGRLLVVAPKHIKGTKRGVRQVHAIEVGVSPDLCLTLSVRTFTSLAYKGNLRRGKVRVDDLPRYELVGHFLRRTFDRGPDDPKAFVERSLRGKPRTEIAFLDLTDEGSFSACKMGVLDEVIQRLGERYGDTVKLSFVEIEDDMRRERKRSKVAEWREGVARSIGDRVVSVVDATGDEGELAASTALKLGKMFGVEVTVAKEITAGMCAIRLIHDEGYYVGEDDPHNDAFVGSVVQHITVENAESTSSKLETVLESSMKELAIKLDMARSHVSLVEWSALGIGGPWSFALRTSKPGSSECACMDIGEDGSISFAVEGWGLFSHGPHADLVEALRASQDAEFAVRGSSGDVNVVSRTSLYSIPDHEAIRKEFESRGFMSRSNENKQRYLTEVTDIACAREGDRVGYYRVGVYSHNMDRTVAKASLIRRVEAVGDSSLLLEGLLPLLDVDFVRMRQLSIVPFPLKYLREWMIAAESEERREDG